jgi:hypothetical protein
MGVVGAVIALLALGNALSGIFLGKAWDYNRVAYRGEPGFNRKIVIDLVVVAFIVAVSVVAAST